MKLSANSVVVVASSFLVTGFLLGLSSTAGQTVAKFLIRPVAEKRLAQLPAGPLYWRIENFPSLEQAEAAKGPISLAAEVAGRAWLFTLGAQGGAIPGGITVAEIGPVPPPPKAPEYLLRINAAGGPPGTKTSVHTHPGSETFYVLAGQLTQRTPHDIVRIEAGESMPGHAPGLAMEVSSSGTTNLSALVMFVVDATRPFSEPSAF
jgi:mannose-6-phosphate isomerase-like protein (cupin superfamily)